MFYSIDSYILVFGDFVDHFLLIHVYICVQYIYLVESNANKCQ